MTKGGARKASADCAVGKGMGLDDHYLALKFANSCEKFTSDEILEYCNKKFARFGQGSRNETPRSWCKELWRYGLIKRLDSNGNEIVLNCKSWSRGAGKYWQITDYGKQSIKLEAKLFPYTIAKLILQSKDQGKFPQCDNFFKLFQKERKIPVNNDQHVLLTKKHGIYVELHAGKSIKNGLLESTGIIFARTEDDYDLNTNFIDSVTQNEIGDLFSDVKEIIDNKDVSVRLEQTFIQTSFEKGKKIIFNIKIKNKSRNDIHLELDSNLNSVFENISRISHEKKINLNPDEEKTICFDLESAVSKQLPNSLMPTFMGTLTLKTKSNEKKIFLPTISIKTDDNIWELTLCSLFKKLNLQVFPFSESDRPDAVIDISYLPDKPEHLVEYMQSDREKLLMETTLGKYSNSKLKDDTIDTKRDGLTKFQKHTIKVVKINAIGQIIVANYFEDNIKDGYKEVSNESKHIVTLIDKKNLEYLISKFEEDGNQSKVIKVLKSNQIVDENLIDSIF